MTLLCLETIYLVSDAVGYPLSGSVLFKPNKNNWIEQRSIIRKPILFLQALLPFA